MEISDQVLLSSDSIDPGQDTAFEVCVPKNAVLEELVLEITGETVEFDEDLLAPSKGASVDPIEVGNGSEGEKLKGLVADFHGQRVTFRVISKADLASKIVLYSWLGSTWSEPKPEDSYGNLLTCKDTEGSCDFPEVEVSKLWFSFEDPLELETFKISCRSTPRNLSVRMGDRPPVWQCFPPLAETQPTSDLSEAANAYLDETGLRQQPGADAAIPFSIRSDARGNVSIRVASMKYHLVADRFADGSTSYSYPFTCDGPLETSVRLRVPDGAMVSSASVDVLGAFGSDRFVDDYGAIVSIPRQVSVEATANRSVADRLVVEEAMTISGVDLLLRSRSATCECQVMLASDAGGVPADAPVAVTKGKLSGSDWVWQCFTFETPFAVGGATWVVVSSQGGPVLWGCQSTDGQSEISFRGTDGAWKRYDGQEGNSYSGCLRIRRAGGNDDAPLLLTSDALPATAVVPGIEEPVATQIQPAQDWTGELTLRARTYGKVTLSRPIVCYTLEQGLPEGGPAPGADDGSSDSGVQEGEGSNEPEVPAGEGEAEPAGAAEPAGEAEPSIPLRSRSVRDVIGIGDVYTKAFEDEGVHTIADLGAAPRETLPKAIPAGLRDDFRQKANLIAGVKVPADADDSLLPETLESLLNNGPEHLVSFGLNQQVAVEFYQTIENLRTVIDDDIFRSLTVADIGR